MPRQNALPSPRLSYWRGIIQGSALCTLCRHRHNIHWCGAPHRLNRDFGKRFGDQAYGFEELVAEIAACALGLQIGLRPQLLDSHAAYLARWVKMLKARPNALMEASCHAQRAVDYLLAFSAPGAAEMASAIGSSDHG